MDDIGTTCHPPTMSTCQLWDVIIISHNQLARGWIMRTMDDIVRS